MGSRWFVFECFIGNLSSHPKHCSEIANKLYQSYVNKPFVFVIPMSVLPKNTLDFTHFFDVTFCSKVPPPPQMSATRARLGGLPDPRNQQIDDSSCDHVDQNHLLEIPNLSSILSKEDTPNFWSPFRKKDWKRLKTQLRTHKASKRVGGEAFKKDTMFCLFLFLGEGKDVSVSAAHWPIPLIFQLGNFAGGLELLGSWGPNKFEIHLMPSEGIRPSPEGFED